MKQKLLFFLISFFSLNLSATHFLGGDITWKCNTNLSSADYGKYTFTLTVYQDCVSSFNFLSFCSWLAVSTAPYTITLGMFLGETSPDPTH